MAKKRMTRPQQWQDAVTRARAALDIMDGAQSDLENALSDLRDLQSEYEEWHGNLPENLQRSATGELLQTITDISIPEEGPDLDEFRSAIDECDNADLPRGFGKD